MAEYNCSHYQRRAKVVSNYMCSRAPHISPHLIPTRALSKGDLSPKVGQMTCLTTVQHIGLHHMSMVANSCWTIQLWMTMAEHMLQYSNHTTGVYSCSLSKAPHMMRAMTTMVVYNLNLHFRAKVVHMLPHSTKEPHKLCYQEAKAVSQYLIKISRQAPTMVAKNWNCSARVQHIRPHLTTTAVYNL